ncbi:uncharacterized protein LOC127657447 isoform X2 [Xyrauchen texanus]|uniref:uncharacterized protein LOC127657447 isoform X2 n=1 Tax=Xyrauchen texanus TaxID=154827 RepID=UPI0022426344|nr:uncharacterized protein LOC127657447 isoform X2 [Xyrauchen texanus]
MLPLLLYIVLQVLSLSQGLNSTDDHPRKSAVNHADHSDKQIELSMLSLSQGCSGVVRAFYQNTTVDVTLNLLDSEEKKELSTQICENLGCGKVFKHGDSATIRNGVCLAGCILRDSQLHNCTTAAEHDCINATKIICESTEISPTAVNTTDLGFITHTAESTAGMATKPGSGVSAAATGCFVLSLALLLLILLNAAVCVHFKRGKACAIRRCHNNSHIRTEYQLNAQMGTYQQFLPTVEAVHQLESLGPRLTSNLGYRMARITNQTSHDSDDSNSEYQNSYRAQRLHQNYSHSKESPSFPEQIPLNHHSTQMTGSTVGYKDHHVPRNLGQETDHRSTTSEELYANVPNSKYFSERDSSVSSDSDNN